MRIAIIGAGPAGSYFGYNCASQNIDTTIFHEAGKGEKPCGGGITFKAFEEFDILREIKGNAKKITSVRVISPSGKEAALGLDEPMHIFSRTEFDSFLRRRAGEAGARAIQEKVIEYIEDAHGWVIRTVSGSYGPFDFLTGADGAAGSTRKKLAQPFQSKDLTQTAGYSIQNATAEAMTLKFYDDMEGYAWSFPRKETISVGIGTPLGRKKPPELLDKLNDFIERYLPSFKKNEMTIFSALIPAINPDEENLRQISGKNWALIGDACGITDPITGEGIFYALKTASLLGETLKRGSAEGYQRLVKDSFGEDISWAYRNKSRFFRNDFYEAAVEACIESSDIASVVSALLSGTLPYGNLMSRLYSIAFKVDMTLLAKLISLAR